MTKKQHKLSAKNGNLITAQTLQQISNSLAYLVVNTGTLKGKKQQDLIPVLSDLGFDKKVIAAVLQATPEAVSERLSERKAEKKKAKQKENVDGEDENQPEAVKQTSSSA